MARLVLKHRPENEFPRSVFAGGAPAPIGRAPPSVRAHAQSVVVRGWRSHVHPASEGRISFLGHGPVCDPCRARCRVQTRGSRVPRGCFRARPGRPGGRRARGRCVSRRGRATGWHIVGEDERMIQGGRRWTGGMMG
eukprot:9473189-Pyramimonas_sp.AAC.1